MNNPVNLFRGEFRPVGKFADFSGDDGKSAPMFPGLRRDNGRIQRQQVGLLHHAVNDLQNLADPVRFLAQNPNGRGGVLHRVLNCANALSDNINRLQAVGGFARNRRKNRRQLLGVALDFFHEFMDFTNRTRRRIGGRRQQFRVSVNPFDGRNHIGDIRERFRHRFPLLPNILHNVAQVRRHLAARP